MPDVVQDAPILVKRYARHRLYDSAATRYRTVDELRQRQADGIAFVVIDAETGEEMIRVLLARRSSRLDVGVCASHVSGAQGLKPWTSSPR